MRVLVACGKKPDGTAALATAVTEGLVQARHSVVLSDAKIDALDRWDAVVVVGSLSVGSWARDARRFVLRHVEALRQVPVWFVSSSPLPVGKAIPRSVTRLARLVGARCHQAVLGAGAAPDLPSARAWARSIGARLHALPLHERVHVPRAMSTVRRLVLWLCVVTGVSAVAGGIGLLTARPPALLRNAFSEGYLVPGLILLLVIGLGNLGAAALEARRIERSELAVFFAGAALTGWILIQLVMIGSLSWLQLVYFLVGLGTLAAARWLWRVRHTLAAFGPHAQR